MGSIIKCIIPRETEYSAEQIKRKLKNAFERRKFDYLNLEKNGRFTKNVSGIWWINKISRVNTEPKYITGEGDSFSLDIYSKVIIITCIERFSSLYLIEDNISNELFNILIEISNEFRSSDEIIIGNGSGEMEAIIDMAYYENLDFAQVCDKMFEKNGKPAYSLIELRDALWYLRK